MSTRTQAFTAHRRQWLVEQFPLCFMPKGAPKLPLAIGIREAIQKVHPEINVKEIAAALADYTGGPTYLRAMQAGAPRIGLAGEPQGIVTEKHAAFADARLAELEARWAAEAEAAA